MVMIMSPRQKMTAYYGKHEGIGGFVVCIFVFICVGRGPDIEGRLTRERDFEGEIVKTITKNHRK